MIKFENECVMCPPEMGCLRDSCPNMHVPHFYCDDCGDEVRPGELFEFDGEELCIDCIKKRLDVVEVA